MANSTAEKENFHAEFSEMKKYMLPDSLVAVMNIMFAGYTIGRNTAIEELRRENVSDTNVS